MDSAVSLAMMRKAQLVFEAADTFLAFPPTALAYDRDDFAFLQGDITPAKLTALREFSREVDRIARGPIASPAEHARLTDVYDEVLTTARLAQSSRTAGEEAEYQAAARFLYTTGADGTREDTMPLKTYKQHRDAWYRAQEDYNNRKIDAQYSSDPAARQRWQTVDEPALRRQLDDLEREWTARGFRAEVERARAVEERLGARSPAVMWESWKKEFNPDIDRLTDPVSNETFFPSAFSPSNVFEAGAWSRFSLNGRAVQTLASEAPAELRGRLGDQIDVEIDSLSFEFASLRIERSWFVPDVFAARFWRLGDGVEPLSIGGASPAGRCPAYVAALVVARRLTVNLKPQSTRNEHVFNALKLRRLAVGNFRIASPEGAGVDRPLKLSAAPARSIRPAAVGPMHVIGGVSPVMMSPAARAVITGPKPRSVVRLKSHTFAAIRPVAPAPPPAPAPASPLDEETVYIMAFICRRLPRCPNPDPDLQW